MPHFIFSTDKKLVRSVHSKVLSVPLQQVLYRIRPSLVLSTLVIYGIAGCARIHMWASKCESWRGRAWQKMHPTVCFAPRPAVNSMQCPHHRIGTTEVWIRLSNKAGSDCPTILVWKLLNIWKLQ